MFKIKETKDGIFRPVLTCDHCKKDIENKVNAVVVYAVRGWKYPAKTVHTGTCQQEIEAGIAHRNSCEVAHMPLLSYVSMLRE